MGLDYYDRTLRERRSVAEEFNQIFAGKSRFSKQRQ
jgi:hypothetical protein